jgi:hypothetical protein
VTSRSPRRWLPIAVAIAATGCRDRSSSDKPPPRPSARDAAPARADAADMPPESAPKITLLDVGAEPRAELRYDLEVGAKEKLTLTMSYSAENRLQAAPPQRLKFPGMRMVFQVEIVETLADDRYRYQFELVDTGLTDTAGADQTLVKMAGAGLKKSVGMRGTAVVDAQGVIREGNLEIPAGLDPSMRVMMESMKSSMEQLSSPLPVKPLGAGARWELRQTLAQAGVSLEQTTTYELVQDAKGKRSLRGAIRQEADRQEVDLPNVEKAELVSLTATGKSELELDLDRLAPRAGFIEIESTSQFEITVQGQSRGLISRGTLELKLVGQ